MKAPSRIVEYAILALTVLGVLWFVLVRPQQALRQAADARTSEIVAKTQGQAAQDTVRIVVDHADTIRTINQRTEDSSHAILQTPGASASIDPELHAAGLRALCLHDGRKSPECADLLHRDGDSQRTGSPDSPRPPSE